MTEHEAIQEVVAESYRTRIDAEELRKDVKVMLNGLLSCVDGLTGDPKVYTEGGITAYKYVLRLIDEKEKGR